MEKFKAIAVFIRVVEAKSFVQAAALLELSPSAVSKSISALEKELGVQLLNRSTRSLRLTEDGAVFYERCRKLLSEYEEIETTLRGSHTVPRGRLRVDMPAVVAKFAVFPALPNFLKQYPEVQVELGVNDRPIDLIQEGYDAVIRMGELKDSSLIARHLCTVRLMTCASPDYLAKYGEPRTLEELSRHNCINYFYVPSGRHYEWKFEQEGVRQSLPVWGNMISNDPDALLNAAIAGVGIYQTASFAVGPHLKSGKLKAVLAEYATNGPSIWLVYPHQQHLSAKVRVFADFVEELFSE